MVKGEEGDFVLSFATSFSLMLTVNIDEQKEGMGEVRFAKYDICTSQMISFTLYTKHFHKEHHLLP